MSVNFNIKKVDEDEIFGRQDIDILQFFFTRIQRLHTMHDPNSLKTSCNISHNHLRLFFFPFLSLSCSHESQVYRRTALQLTSELTGDVEDRPAVSESFADYDTACSECSYATCQSFSADSDGELDACSSSGSDTIIDELFTVPKSCTIEHLPDDTRPYPMSDAMKWDSEVC